MKIIKYYHLSRKFSDEKPLDFTSLENAYRFLTNFFKDKAKVWHCDGVDNSRTPTSFEWVKAVMDEMGTVEFEIITKEGETYDLWLSEKEIRFIDLDDKKHDE